MSIPPSRFRQLQAVWEGRGQRTKSSDGVECYGILQHVGRVDAQHITLPQAGLVQAIRCLLDPVFESTKGERGSGGAVDESGSVAMLRCVCENEVRQRHIWYFHVAQRASEHSHPVLIS